MTVGNKEITDLTLVSDPTGTDMYCVKTGADFRIRTGVANGLATLDGSGKLLAAQAPTSGTVTNVTGTAPIASSGGATPAISITAATTGAAGSMSAADKAKLDGVAAGATANAGTVTNLSVTSANGVSGSVATSTTTPAITLSLGAITPASVAASGTVTGSNLSGTHSGSSSGTNTGDQNLAPYAQLNSPAFTGNPTAPNITLGGGKLLTKLTLSASPPGTLVDGELYMKY
jgi:hypothetical protein